jgi:hypothetical protein
MGLSLFILCYKFQVFAMFFNIFEMSPEKFHTFIDVNS